MKYYHFALFSFFGACLALLLLAILKPTDNNLTPHSIKYIKDNNTNLCFAEQTGGYGITMANVPCTTEVLQLIQK